MAQTPEEIAKDIMLALIKKMKAPSITQSPQELGNRVGEIYKALYRQIKEATGQAQMPMSKDEIEGLDRLAEQLSRTLLQKKT